jgi:hypothetical protein
VAGDASARLEPISFVIVAAAGTLGLLATYAWFGRADQTR